MALNYDRQDKNKRSGGGVTSFIKSCILSHYKLKETNFFLFKITKVDSPYQTHKWEWIQNQIARCFLGKNPLSDRNRSMWIFYCFNGIAELCSPVCQKFEHAFQNNNCDLIGNSLFWENNEFLLPFCQLKFLLGIVSWFVLCKRNYKQLAMFIDDKEVSSLY